MPFFAKTTVRKPRTSVRELSPTEIVVVAGGLNPQPLPPIHDPVTRSRS